MYSVPKLIISGGWKGFNSIAVHAERSHVFVALLGLEIYKKLSHAFHYIKVNVRTIKNKPVEKPLAFVIQSIALTWDRLARCSKRVRCATC